MKSFLLFLRRSYWRERRANQAHELEMLRFYSQFVKRGDLCFDVGANVGNRTDVFLKLGATVVAVEPQVACMQKLKSRYSRTGSVFFVEKALGEEPGEHELLVSDASTISSMSREWIDRVRESGRFSDHQWDESVVVPVTTLDALIDEYGVPALIKIDVEGYETHVLKGMTRPAKVLSFEFVAEAMQNAVVCLQYLASLGRIECNCSHGETMALALDHWVTEAELLKRLALMTEPGSWGDVYVRFVETEQAGESK